MGETVRRHGGTVKFNPCTRAVASHVDFAGTGQTAGPQKPVDIVIGILGLVRSKLFDRFPEFELKSAGRLDGADGARFGEEIFELYSRTWLSISGVASLAILLS